jgi:hypothetical protein
VTRVSQQGEGTYQLRIARVVAQQVPATPVQRLARHNDVERRAQLTAALPPAVRRLQPAIRSRSRAG